MKNLPTLRSDSSFAVQFSNLVSKTRSNKGSFAVYDKDYRNVWTPGKYATDAIRWYNPAKISHNYTQLCEYLDNQPIKITTRFSGSSVVTGRH